MIWIIRIFLLAYAVLYFGIGAWAIIDPVKDALNLSEIPSYMNAVGLTISSIAFGRFLFALIPSTPTYLNTFFIFEVTTFILSLSCYLYLRLLYNPRKSANIENVAGD